ncbi:HNH endonuclease signature motif containing protein [Mycolicibacterium austroafricanum]|uniref:HNH endonuclease signature motif containing protein n=1 Tax=Mycolicibacterium austroafricanum TaxID=39687 RepID=UPI001CA30A3B|nr:HNH endonuclease signature motif containing protein [Mycolicibacterium austroafricanum]QZT63879.1 HNH endonuclease [Mycolicibacterium austroafricanum]
MDVVSEAVAAIAEQVAVLSKAAEQASHRELIGLLAQLTQVLRSVPTLEHQILARLTAETEPHRLGEGSWKKVLTTSLRVSGAEAGRRLSRAKTLGPRCAMTGELLAPLWQATAAAQAQGLLSEEHVAVIAKFHKALPAWVDVDTRAHADRQLARKGAGVGPEELDEAAGRLLMMIDQDGPEPCDKDLARKRSFRVGKQQPDGFRRVSGYVDAELGAYLDATLAKEAAPGANMPTGQSGDDGPGDEEPGSDEPDSGEGPDGGEPGSVERSGDEVSGGGEAAEQRGDRSACTSARAGRDTRTQDQRNHDGLKALLRRLLGSGRLGSHNGLPVTVVVSTTLQELEKGAGVAVTGGGSLLPMPDLIRLAARAHHYLYVYDQHTGQSLYLGRAKRLANAAQRIVLHARDRGCTRPGCTAPGYWCQAHHASADFGEGGLTNIDDLALACPCAHSMLDKTGWRTRQNGKNQTEWHPPPDLDTGQHRTNDYHHPERHLLFEDDEDDDP